MIQSNDGPHTIPQFETETDDGFRMAMPMRTLAKRAQEKREADARVHATVVNVLSQGRPLTPEDVKAARAGEAAVEPSPGQ